jgi:methionine sulfoxide reductase catalytic subunit
MATPILRPAWAIPLSKATPPAVYWDRRRFLKAAAGAALALAGGACGGNHRSGAEVRDPVRLRPAGPLETIPEAPSAHLYPAAANLSWRVPERPLTDRLVAATHNNFYEFLLDKARVWENVGPFQARPWDVEVVGEVERPGVFDVVELERTLGLEERTYRFRCVEAWSMTVPWTGFPLHRLLARVQPLSSGRYVRFVSFYRPEEAVGQRTQPWYPWPYYEALRMDEALHELTLVVTGIYGAPLPKQHGAPIRIVVPWKYGYKSPKSVVRIEVTRDRPPIFWNDVTPAEYRFFSNVNPDVPHPRWSQATEELIGEERRVPTLLLNGYAEWAAGMYSREILNSLS